MNDCLYVPRAEFVAHSSAFAALHAGLPTQGYVGNIDVQVETVEFDGLPFPVTINETGGENAWVCSPLTTYSRYALEETRRTVPRALGWPLTAVIGAADRWLLAAGLDRAVSVNNWLLSTNLYPSADGIDFYAVRDALKARWPRHAIWFRSLNVVQHAYWLRALAAAGFELIPTRQVYVFRDVERCASTHQNLKRDLKLLRSTPLQQVDGSTFSVDDFAACEALYGQLYLEKYSRLNPRYTAAFLQAWHRAGLLELTGFRDESGQLRAVIGIFSQGPLLTAPIVGYDTAWPQSAGLYRLLMAHVLSVTRECAGTLNLSAGASHFKRLRGGEPAIEYSAVLCGHLPKPTRRARIASHADDPARPADHGALPTLNTWNPSLARSWFVVARSSQIGRKPHAVTLLDRPLVIARGPSGELFALDDCCPHRHVPLSAGRMTEQGLQCAYHGWTFGADGRCVAIPGLSSDACRPFVRVAAASVMEYDGLIWVRLDGEADPGAIASALPAFVRRPPARARRFVWHARWNARALDALENFLDAQHTHFVHAGIVRDARRRAAVEVTVARTGSALQVDYEGQPDQSGWLYRLFESKRELERAHFDASAAGTAQLEYRYRNGSALYFTLHFSPVSEAVTQVHGTLHVENRWAPRWAVRFLAWPMLRRVLQQDRAIVEAQAWNRQRCGRGEGISTELDLVRPALDAAWSFSGDASADSLRKVRVLL